MYVLGIAEAKQAADKDLKGFKRTDRAVQKFRNGDS